MGGKKMGVINNTAVVGVFGINVREMKIQEGNLERKGFDRLKGENRKICRRMTEERRKRGMGGEKVGREGIL